jgi:Fe(3+) dicitrate transport protein
MKLHKLASMLASTSIALSAFADDHGGDSPDYLSPFNVIGTKSDISYLEGTGTVLDSEELGPFFHTDITEILRQVPGVYVRPEEGYGFFPNISIRGNDPNRSGKVTILEDGIPSSPAPFSDPSAYYSPTAGRMAGFEILKGSSQLKHGPNTTGGVLNYLSTPIPNEQKSYFRASYGDYSEVISHAYSGGKLNFGGGQLGYLLEVFDHRSDGWKTLNMAPMNNPDRSMPISKTDMNFKLGYEFAGGGYLEFKYGNTFMDADVSYQGEPDLATFNSNPYSVPFTSAWDNMDSHQHRYYLRYINELSENVGFTTTLFHNEFNRNWYKSNGVKNWNYDAAYRTANGLPAASLNISTPEDDVHWQVKSNNRNYKVTGLQGNFDIELGANDIDLGFRVMKEDYTQNPYHIDDYNYTHATNSVQIAANTYDADGDDPYLHSESMELYLTDTITIGSLNVTPGIRYTSVDYTYKTDKGSLDDTLVGIGANYELAESTILFAGLHQGHAMPGSKAAQNTATSMKEIEESVCFEIGVRGALGKLFYEVAFFNTDFENLLAAKSLANNVSNTYNVGDANTRGIEGFIATDLGENFGIGIPVSLTATFTDSEFEKLSATSSSGFTGSGFYADAEVGNSFAFIPDTQLNFRIGLEFDKKSTYLNYHYQDDVFTTAGNTESLESYGVLDWSGFLELKEGVTAFAKVTNLTDNDYAHSNLPRGYRPGAPRVWSLGMEFDF